MKQSSKVIGAVAVFLLAGLIGYASWKGFTQPSKAEDMLGAANNPTDSTFVTGTPQYGTQDVVGSHFGTTTVGLNLGTPYVTSSFVSRIGRDKKEATYQIKIVSVSTTDNEINFTVQGSNDYLCETQAPNAIAATNTVMSNINWYDAMNHLTGRVQPVTMSNGSSTVIFNWNDATAGSAKEITLDHLNYECLRFLVSNSSTMPYVGLNTRSN